MSENILLSKLTRRTFIKATAAATAVAAVGDKLFGGPVSTLVESAAAAPQAVTEDVWIKTGCDSCDTGCGILVHRVNGVAVKVEGNPDDKNAGNICGRGQALPMLLYNPYRVKAPMKRTNPEKGADVDPKWVEITWDEALDTIAQNLRAISEKDPRRLVLLGGHRVNDTRDFWRYMGKVLGTPTYNNTGFGGQTCFGCLYHTLGAWVVGAFTTARDHTYSNYIMTSYAAYGANKAEPEAIRTVFTAKDRGAKFVALDPVLAPAWRNVVDEWIPIKPGTDVAFMLAMVHTIIYELGIYDVEFLKKRTNAPYLIGPDGLYVRASEPLIEDPARVKQELGKPLIWDPVDGKAKMFDDPTIQDFALDGKYTVNGVECQPAFQVLKDHVRQYTPEWAERITTVPAATIRRLTKEFVDAAQIGSTIVVEGEEMPLRPAVCTFGLGRGGVTAYTMDLGMLWVMPNVLVGNINVPGGLLGSTPPNMTPDPVDGVLQPGKGYHTARYHPIQYPPQRADIKGIHPMAYKTDYLIFPAILNPREYGLEYEVEAMGILGCNPLAGGAGLETVRAAFAKVPFIFALSYQFDEPTEWADIVLPESSFAERHQATGRISYKGWSPTGQLVDCQGIRQPVVDKPVFNTREGNDTIIDLCERLGILYGERGLNNEINKKLAEGYQLDLNTKYKWTEILDRQLTGQYGDEHGLEWFKEHGLLVRPYKVEDYYGTPKWPTTRVPIYFEYVVWVRKKYEEELRKYNVTKIGPYESIQALLDEYYPLPTYREQPDADAPPEYDLWVCNYKTMLHTMAMPMDNAWTHAVAEEMNPYDMAVWMNADTAAKKGLKDGDLVWVESRYGKTRGEVKASQCVHPEAVGIGGCFGLHSANAPAFIREGPSWNALIPLVEKKGKFTNPVTGGNHMHVKVKVYKA